MATKIQVRRDTPDNWTSANPVLSAGEIGVEIGSAGGTEYPNKWKIGDGTKTWTQLTYQFPILVGGSGTTPDGTTLVVDQTNDRVGIGTASPSDKLSVSGTLGVSGATALASTLAVTGNTTLTGDLAVNSGNITKASGTANVFNSGATTLNIGGAATSVGIGAATGTTTINNATTAITGNLAVNTNKFNVTAANGNTAIAGTLSAQATTLASLALTTDLPISEGGTGASTATTARANLGCGTIATQDSNNVSITGGTISGITDLAIADGGTGASTAANARANLGIFLTDSFVATSAFNASYSSGGWSKPTNSQTWTYTGSATWAAFWFGQVYTGNSTYTNTQAVGIISSGTGLGSSFPNFNTTSSTILVIRLS